VFFALPGGSGLEYSLSGTSEPPKPINRISRDVPCKTEYTEPLTVDNWLSKPQRSASSIIILKHYFTSNQKEFREYMPTLRLNSTITGHLSQASEDSSVHRVIFEHTSIVTD